MIIIKILSLFDGISGGQIALNNIGITNYTYYASEINKDSIAVTQKNFPNTIQLGDVTQISNNQLNELGELDLLIFGSPCTDLSIIKSKTRESLKGNQSGLFYEALRIKNYLNPKYFLMENVVSMKNESKNIISKELNIQPIIINSNIFAAQDRERYYWTNIPLNPLPKSKNLILKDIMESNVKEKYYYKKNFTFNGWNKRVIATLHINCHDMGKRVYNPNMTCATLTAIRGGYQEKKVYDNNRCRKLTPLEYERLQTIPDGYTYMKGLSDNKRRSMLGDGFTIKAIEYILQNIN
jgi:DNA (cytosine-5)-methyltransferase 3A